MMVGVYHHDGRPPTIMVVGPPTIMMVGAYHHDGGPTIMMVMMVGPHHHNGRVLPSGW